MRPLCSNLLYVTISCSGVSLGLADLCDSSCDSGCDRVLYNQKSHLMLIKRDSNVRGIPGAVDDQHSLHGLETRMWDFFFSSSSRHGGRAGPRFLMLPPIIFSGGVGKLALTACTIQVGCPCAFREARLASLEIFMRYSSSFEYESYLSTHLQWLVPRWSCDRLQSCSLLLLHRSCSLSGVSLE